MFLQDKRVCIQKLNSKEKEEVQQLILDQIQKGEISVQRGNIQDIGHFIYRRNRLQNHKFYHGHTAYDTDNSYTRREKYDYCTSKFTWSTKCKVDQGYNNDLVVKSYNRPRKSRIPKFQKLRMNKDLTHNSTKNYNHTLKSNNFNLKTSLESHDKTVF